MNTSVMIPIVNELSACAATFAPILAILLGTKVAIKMFKNIANGGQDYSGTYKEGNLSICGNCGAFIPNPKIGEITSWCKECETVNIDPHANDVKW